MLTQVFLDSLDIRSNRLSTVEAALQIVPWVLGADEEAVTRQVILKLQHICSEKVTRNGPSRASQAWQGQRTFRMDATAEANAENVNDVQLHSNRTVVLSVACDATGSCAQA